MAKTPSSSDKFLYGNSSALRERLTTNADGATSPYKVKNKSKLSLHIVHSNTDSVGTITVQGSDDVDWENNRDGNWVDLHSGIVVSSGNDVNELYDPLISMSECIRVYYDRDSGGAADSYIYCFIHETTR